MKKVKPKARVLIVEDDTFILLAVKDMFESEGCEVDIAPSGKVGLEKLTSQRYDLVIMDNRLGDMLGLKLIVLFREHEDKQFPDERTPVVAVSSEINKKTEKKFIEMGFDLAIPKPLSAAAIKEIVRVFIGI